MQLVLEHLLVELFNHIFELVEAASSDFGQICALDRLFDLLLCVFKASLLATVAMLFFCSSLISNKGPP